jgi:hypothetical protein
MKRRDFIQETSITSGAIMLAPYVMNNYPMVGICCCCSYDCIVDNRDPMNSLKSE